MACTSGEGPVSLLRAADRRRSRRRSGLIGPQVRTEELVWGSRWVQRRGRCRRRRWRGVEVVLARVGVGWGRGGPGGGAGNEVIRKTEIRPEPHRDEYGRFAKKTASPTRKGCPGSSSTASAYPTLFLYVVTNFGLI
ncbi:hypothetical protein ABZP36_007705 [Zizania latifolia]